MLDAVPMMPFEGAADAGGRTVAAGITLDTLALGAEAQVVRVEAVADVDPIAERLRELGFVADEWVRLVATGPLGAEPLLVQVGFTRFALRRAEAARVRVLRGP